MASGYEDLRSDRVNLLSGSDLDPNHPLCFEHVCALVEALIPAENDRNPFFPLKSQELYGGLLKQELKEAEREQRDPSLLRVRLAATEREKLLRARVARIMAEGDPQICSLLGDFAGEFSDGIRDVIATGAAYTRWVLSSAVAEDEKSPGIDLAQLGQVPSTLYYGVPHDLVKTFAPYLRLFTTALLQPLLAPHPIPVCLYLNEFSSMGRVPLVESSIGLVAGCKIQLVLVVQSLATLKEHYGDGWEAFFGNAGAVILVGGANDDFTAEYFSKRSGDLTIRQPNVGLNINPGGIGLSSGQGFHIRRNLPPQELHSIPDGQGFIWIAGQNDPIPAIFPPYYDDPMRPELKRRARKNPWYG
ncbi:MAG TPA: type IV secretory system conjugative DNA transfer family protein [Stellaceae bacterium]|nr:type IV secretory system conjugative DNA transfer family protein [Stellaceae bacterium]